MKTLTTYPQLLKQIKLEIAAGQRKIEQTKAQVYWKVGKYIHTHILKNKEQAGHNQKVFKRLAKDLNVSKSLLHHTVEFYREFQSVHAHGHLGWEHYKKLLGVSDLKVRKNLLTRTITEKLTTRQLAEEIKKQKKKLTTDHHPRTTPLKPPVQGRLYTYKSRPGKKGYIYVDLGFKITRQIRSRIQMEKSAFVHSAKEADEYRVKKIKATKNDLFMYKAYLERVVDGDTLILHIDLGFDTFIKEAVRLRGVNTPEKKTLKGLKAKHFVSVQVKSAKDIMVKTHWEDKFGRYLVDLWADNTYLNQELIHQGLAQRIS